MAWHSRCKDVTTQETDCIWLPRSADIQTLHHASYMLLVNASSAGCIKSESIPFETRYTSSAAPINLNRIDERDCIMLCLDRRSPHPPSEA